MTTPVEVIHNPLTTIAWYHDGAPEGFDLDSVDVYERYVIPELVLNSGVTMVVMSHKALAHRMVSTLLMAYSMLDIPVQRHTLSEVDTRHSRVMFRSMQPYQARGVSLHYGFMPRISEFSKDRWADWYKLYADFAVRLWPNASAKPVIY